ncbi:hypothetical protein SAMN06295885_0244 [Rathayibacter oskolensis]|uniref:Uncharacterized protein n=1 Tax=Rathayibacter oskolensis TaxID=1891671 RepID=A0A1X7MXZ8_9MICO|nr:hypothetical protein [Rathayibacter oskolensis]SMH28896.1 hypothetical protein SAMN06295885_0244 [Rathayibacter oskolensis]
MSITALSPPPVLEPAAPTAGPPSRVLRRPPTREPGLTAVALGLLALTSAVHPLWVLASAGLALAGAVHGVVALMRPGERRWGAVGLTSAVLAFAVASVTVPAALRGAAAALAWVAALRPGGA